MASRTIVTFTDDLDGSDANGTVKFSFDGTDYEIDLNDDNETKLRELLATYIEAGRKVKVKRGPRKAKAGSSEIGSSTPRATGGTSDAAVKRARNQAIREWAAANGWDVPARGRIAAEIVEAYEAANPEPVEAAA